MTQALIVSTARTPLAKSWRGAFNMTHGSVLGGHVVKHALERAGVQADMVEDVIMGCANPEGATGWNIARQSAIAAGLPMGVSGMTVNRFCSSGLQTIALAAQRIIAGEAQVFIAGGVESISCVQQEINMHMFIDPALQKKKPEIYWNMLQTAEQVAKRYHIDRETMDAYGAQSQQKACHAQDQGLFDEEIVPITTRAGVLDPVMGLMTKQVTVSRDEGTRAGTTVQALSAIKAATPGGLVAAGNASQFSDGAGACVVMDEQRVAQLGLKPLGRIASFASSGLDPAFMGMGPVPASQKALARAGWKAADLDLLEINEAFAAQACAVNNEMGWDTSKVNVNGGAIAIGHPIGASGCRILVTLLHEMQRRDAKKGIASLCIGGGMGVALTIER